MFYTHAALQHGKTIKVKKIKKKFLFSDPKLYNLPVTSLLYCYIGHLLGFICITYISHVLLLLLITSLFIYLLMYQCHIIDAI